MTEPIAAQASEHEHADFRPLYYKIFAALITLTIVTVAVSYVPFKEMGSFGYPLSVAVAFGIAALKASMVVMYFMHVKFDGKEIYVLIAVPLLAAAMLLFGLMPDVAFNGW